MKSSRIVLILYVLKRLCSSGRIFQDSSNSKSTVRRCSETCESALESRTKITRYDYKLHRKPTFNCERKKRAQKQLFYKMREVTRCLKNTEHPSFFLLYTTRHLSVHINLLPSTFAFLCVIFACGRWQTESSPALLSTHLLSTPLLHVRLAAL